MNKALLILIVSSMFLCGCSECQDSPPPQQNPPPQDQIDEQEVRMGLTRTGEARFQ